jgi:hypothetical protein
VGFDINQSRVAELKSGIDTTWNWYDYWVLLKN